MNAAVRPKAQVPRAVCRVIEDRDLPNVRACLIRHFPERSPRFWLEGLDRLSNREPVAEFPRYGYCLAAGDEVVGVLLQIYSFRETAGGRQVYCHHSSWCVDEAYRLMAPLLSIAATKRKDVSYVNISPALHTRRGIEALGFQQYSTGQMIFFPILSRLAKGARIESFVRDSIAAQSLPPAEWKILSDHQQLGCRAFIGVLDGDASGFLTVRSRILRNRLPCERIIYCRDVETLSTFARSIGTYLARRGAGLCVANANVPIAGLVGRFVADRDPQYFRGPAPPAFGDLAYSELVYIDVDDFGPRRSEISSAPNRSSPRLRGFELDGAARSEIASIAAQTPAAPTIVTGRAQVRSLAAGDLPEVASIFRGVFRKQSAAGSIALERDIETIFLRHPHYEESTSALVYERAKGGIGGFLGSLPVRASYMGAPRLGSVMSTWMVGDQSRDPRAGAMLLHGHLKRGHAFTFVDTANKRSSEFRRSLKMALLTTHSLQWIKPLNYLGYAASSLDKGRGGGLVRVLSRTAQLSEFAFRRLTTGRPTGREAEVRSARIDAATFANHFLRFAAPYALRPDWSCDFVEWLLKQCDRRPTLGPLSLCEVRDRRDAIIGCYAFHVTPQRRALVVQLLADRGAEAEVLRALIGEAEDEKCVVVCGSTNAQILDGLFCIPGVFYRHTCTTAVRTRQGELLQSFLTGDALVGGLVGDSWMPLTAEPYD